MFTEPNILALINVSFYVLNTVLSLNQIMLASK